MGRRGGEVVGCCVACFAISTSRGTLVAKLDDVNVRPGLEGQGIGSAMLSSLKEELRRAGVTRIDTATHFDNPGARRFYERHGFAIASRRAPELPALIEPGSRTGLANRVRVTSARPCPATPR